MCGTKQWNLDLFVVMLTYVTTISLNCQAQTVSAFMCLRVQAYAAVSMWSLVGLEIHEKKSRKENVSCKYILHGLKVEYCISWFKKKTYYWSE